MNATPRTLIRYLKTLGWDVVRAFDGEEWTKVEGEKAAMEVVESVDWSNLEFRLGGPRVDAPSHRVAIVLSSDEDWLTDWSLTPGDPDGFDAAIDDFMNMAE